MYVSTHFDANCSLDLHELFHVHVSNIYLVGILQLIDKWLIGRMQEMKIDREQFVGQTPPPLSTNTQL